MPIGAVAALGLALSLWILRKPRLARLALGFAAACMQGVLDARLSGRVDELQARSGSDV